MAINTSQIIQAGLEIAGWTKTPRDSGVHVPGRNIRKVLMAIDVGTAELLLAKQLGCDAVVAHHPIGIASVNFHRVFDRHVDFMIESGVQAPVARNAVKKLKERVESRTHSEIYDQVVGAAKVLKMPLVNVHQPCDEFMRRTIAQVIKNRSPEKVSDLIGAVSSIPEFRNSEVKPAIRIGRPNSRLGKHALVIAAGTNGGYGIARAYFEAGVDTVIYLHMDYGELTKLRETNLAGNLVVLGHLPGDSVGMNGLSSKLESKGIETVKIGILAGK